MMMYDRVIRLDQSIFLKKRNRPGWINHDTRQSCWVISVGFKLRCRLERNDNVTPFMFRMSKTYKATGWKDLRITVKPIIAPKN